MKTQVIRLDIYDDVISTRDKMGWSQAARILLIWPSRGRILYRPVDLILLKRHSASLGAQLAFVTNDTDVRYYADQFGIPTFDNPIKAQNEHWRSSRKRKPKPIRRQPKLDFDALRAEHRAKSLPWLDSLPARIGLFIISLLAIICMGIVILPQAEVSLAANTQAHEITIPVFTSPESTAIHITGELPAYQKVITVEGRDSITSSGTVEIPMSPAVASIEITNLTDQIVPVPEGTIVSSLGQNPVRFRITRAGNLAAGPGRKSTLPATAILPGTAGNLPADALVAVEGSIGLKVAANNPLPAHGGKDVLAPAPTSGDRIRLKERLISNLQQTALEELQKNLLPGDRLLLPTIRLARVIEESYLPAELQASNNLELILRLEYQALTVRDDDLQMLARQVLDSNLPDGYLPSSEIVEVADLNQPATGDDEITRWRIRARRDLQASIDKEQAAESITGQTVKQAQSILTANFPIRDKPAIRLYPAWWPRLPFLPMRINIITNASEP